MKTLALLAITLGSFVVACAPPTTINITPSGGTNNNSDGGSGGSGGSGGVGATGGSDIPEPEPTAHDEYINVVHPSIIQTCGGCHNPQAGAGAPAFLDYDPEVSYLVIKDYPGVLTNPAESVLITQPPHTGPALNAGQKDIVTNWLNMELAEGGGTTTTTSSSSGGSQAMTLEEMLDSFAACMDYDIWLATGMDKLPLQQTADGGPCASCHGQGTAGFFASNDSLETFDKNKSFPYILRLVSPIYGTDSNPTDLAPSNRIINKGKEPCANPPVCHPKYELSPENKQALETFVGGTLTKWQAGECGKI
ncbi:MAG: hypothetical protein IPK82_09160 [Polyangiaceae bacterium]|nr:hypothetical protein [Polyangiaceae bacterium]